MSESSANSIRTFTPRPPVINQTFGQLRHWLMVGSQLIFVLAMIIGLFVRKRPEDGMLAIMWLAMGWAIGWTILWPIHVRQRQRISTLEDQLSKLELSKADSQ